MSFSEWKEYKLGELYDVSSGLSKSREQFGFGHPFVTFKDVFDNYFLPDKLGSLANTTEKEINTCSVKEGDIFLTRTSETLHELGMSSVALKSYDKATFNGFTKRLRLKPGIEIKINPLFIGYYLRGPHFRKQIDQHASLTTRASLNGTSIKSLEICLPDLLTQKNIGELLKCIDDKISINRQTNQTRETIAQALFKEWFVNFNFPGATGKMQESELGMIPEGWRVGKLGEVCELVYGKALKAELRIPGPFPVVGSNGIVDTHNEFLVQGPGIVIGRKGTIGEVTWLHDNFFPIDTTFYIKDSIGTNKLYYHYFLLRHQDFKKIGSDSAVPGLNRNQASASKIVIPTLNVINQFNSISESIFDKININVKQIVTLTALRDSLLPRLMRGEVIV